MQKKTKTKTKKQKKQTNKLKKNIKNKTKKNNNNNKKKQELSQLDFFLINFGFKFDKAAQVTTISSICCSIVTGITPFSI